MIEIRYVPSEKCWKASSWTLGYDAIIRVTPEDAEDLACAAAHGLLSAWLLQANDRLGGIVPVKP